MPITHRKNLDLPDKTPIEKVEVFVRAWTKKARFVVAGPNGKYSTVWAAWETNDSIYVAPRSVGGVLKASLHPNSGYRFAFTKEFYKKLDGVTHNFKKRDFAIWPKPKIIENSVTLILSICFPNDFFQAESPPDIVKKSILILQSPSQRCAGCVGFFQASGSTDDLEMYFKTFGKPLIHWDFDDGSKIFMVYWEVEFDKNILPRPDSQTPMIPLTDEAKKLAFDVSNEYTAMLWNEPTAGEPLQIIELGGQSLL